MDNERSESSSASTSTPFSRRTFLQGVGAAGLAVALSRLDAGVAEAEAGSITLTWHGQATTEIRAEGKRFFIDAFFAQNRAGAPSPGSAVDLLLLTHGHADHFGQTIDLLRDLPTLKVVGNSELVRNLMGHGLAAPDRLIDVNKGGKLVKGRTVASPAGVGMPFPDVGAAEILMVPADHTSSLRIPTGTFVTGGASVGYLIRFASGFTLYHAGDTYVFQEMEMIGELHPDLALVPIGGNFTMDPIDAARAVADLIQPRFVVPIHYPVGAPSGTVNPALYGTPQDFITALHQRDPDQNIQVLVPARGQPLQLTGAGSSAAVRIVS